jgi:hypothetical protein
MLLRKFLKTLRKLGLNTSSKVKMERGLEVIHILLMEEITTRFCCCCCFFCFASFFFFLRGHKEARSRSDTGRKLQNMAQDERDPGSWKRGGDPIALRGNLCRPQ